MNVPARDIATLFGGEKVLGRKVRDYADLDAVIEAGLPVGAVDEIRNTVAGKTVVVRSRQAIAAFKRNNPERVHGVGQGLFMAKAASPERSRKLERLARLYALAERVFGGRAYANEFLHKPHSRLDGRAPIECIETELATKQVEQILNAIAYGLPA